ncbi:hypothetical protein SteCoe_16397 [Stentor coeruleus]|uniref:Myb-like DNA-binding domain containing protein n=1 Tax=Stentor coeruleus TaxID=5963 RepID=A0A1R2C1D5_9CILI|nr:hypothetical protein SteCoe_16397 [Stentor coeruleus]
MDIVYSSFQQAGITWVPCIPDYATGTFIPVYNLTNIPIDIPNSVTTLPRGGIKTKPWNHAEDLLLKDLVVEYGTKKWAKIARALNKSFNNHRKGKHCRERWNNHLNPDINKSEWSYEEDLKLLIEFKKIGKKWSSISKCLNGRTENAVKNRWNTLMKSVQKTVNSGNNEMAIDFLIHHIKEIISMDNKGIV